MALYTKAITEPPSIDDGIRICIMRKPTQNTQWDIWMPTLAPSEDLLNDYLKGAIDWDGYLIRFEQEVLIGRKNHLAMLIDMSRNYSITILCHEQMPEKCHRRLIAEYCHNMAPDLLVTIK